MRGSRPVTMPPNARSSRRSCGSRSPDACGQWPEPRPSARSAPTCPPQPSTAPGSLTPSPALPAERRGCPKCRQNRSWAPHDAVLREPRRFRRDAASPPATVTACRPAQPARPVRQPGRRLQPGRARRGRPLAGTPAARPDLGRDLHSAARRASHERTRRALVSEAIRIGRAREPRAGDHRLTMAGQHIRSPGVGCKQRIPDPLRRHHPGTASTAYARRTRTGRTEPQPSHGKQRAAKSLQQHLSSYVTSQLIPSGGSPNTLRRFIQYPWRVLLTPAPCADSTLPSCSFSAIRGTANHLTASS
jgi:hypothetical protein